MKFTNTICNSFIFLEKTISSTYIEFKHIISRARLKLLITLFFLTFQVQANQLENYCQENKGEIFKSYQCPKSKLKLPVKTCEFNNDLGETLFVNGCSGPSGGHSELFFRACVKHDLCYHHEPSTNGYNRKDCDQLFLRTALESCSQASNQKKCQRWANLMYNSLRIIGGPAFHCSDSPADY